MVTGPPAAGKSTLAERIAEHMQLPLLAKDAFKQDLLAEHGATTPEESRELGRQAVRVLLRVEHGRGRGVLEGVWGDRAAAVTGP